MKSNFATRVLRALGVAGATALLAAPAFAQAAGPTVNKGDSAFMFVSTVIVLLMTIPGLALFYGGMVRTKNMLSMLMQVFAIVCVVAIIWVVYGYSMAFTSGGEFNSYVGGFSKLFLAGVDTTTLGGTFSHNASIPEYAFVAFQMTFACITPALIVGAFAERMKFSAIAALHRPVGDVRLLPDRTHGLVLGWPGCLQRSCRQATMPSRPRPSLTLACSGAGAPSTSQAAPSCTSTPASLAWLAR